MHAAANASFRQLSSSATSKTFERLARLSHQVLGVRAFIVDGVPMFETRLFDDRPSVNSRCEAAHRRPMPGPPFISEGGIYLDGQRPGRALLRKILGFIYPDPRADGLFRITQLISQGLTLPFARRMARAPISD